MLIKISFLQSQYKLHPYLFKICLNSNRCEFVSRTTKIKTIIKIPILLTENKNLNFKLLNKHNYYFLNESGLGEITLFIIVT